MDKRAALNEIADIADAHRQLGYDDGYRAGLEAAAKLIEGLAAEGWSGPVHIRDHAARIRALAEERE